MVTVARSSQPQVQLQRQPLHIRILPHIRAFQKKIALWLRLFNISNQRLRRTRKAIFSYILRYPSRSFVFCLVVFLCAFGCWYVVFLRIFSTSLPPLPGIDDQLINGDFEAENQVARRHVCGRTYLENNYVLLHACSKQNGDERANEVKQEKQGDNKQIVALVQVRNIEQTVGIFFKSLSKVADKIVALDDHSTDTTRRIILSLSLARQLGTDTQIFLLNKTKGAWENRQELYDRQMLLRSGRLIGGTHFILLDYDEYFTSNCVSNNLLRSTILKLEPRQSLYIPWIELWKSPMYHATVKTRANNWERMNFLNRKQIVIFGDDGKLQYTTNNSLAKVLSPSKNSSIHVLRCPNDVCSMRNPRNNNVKKLLQCGIVEMRFLNLDNVLLKSIWYEMLGRIMGIDDGSTLGKMVKVLFYNNNYMALHDESKLSFNVVPTDPSWFEHMDEEVFNAYSMVELWRAYEIAKWYNSHGYEKFFGLRLLPLIEIGELQHSLQVLSKHFADSDAEWQHGAVVSIPRKKTGCLFVMVDQEESGLLDQVVHLFALEHINFSSTLQSFSTSHEDADEGIRRKNFNTYIVNTILGNMKENETGNEKSYGFITCNLSSDIAVLKRLFDVIHTELPFLTTYITFAIRTTSTSTTTNESNSNSGNLYNYVLPYAMQIGGHISVLDVPIAAFGSATSLLWLRNTLFDRAGIVDDVTYHHRDSVHPSKLLEFAEGVHKRYGDKFKLAPVAKMLFSLNVGRSGSNHLANVLSTSSNRIVSLHEPACPNKECTNGGGLSMQNRSLEESYEYRKRVKTSMVYNAMVDLLLRASTDSDKPESIVQRLVCKDVAGGSEMGRGVGSVDWMWRSIVEVSGIDECEMHSLPDAVYSETNPNFKAWFYDVILDTFPVRGYAVNVIAIRKYLAAVLKSLYETGFFSVKNGYTWMETLSSINSKCDSGTLHRLSYLLNDAELTTMEKLMAYIVNSECTFRYIQTTYAERRNVRLHQVRAEELYDEAGEGAVKLMGKVGVAVSASTVRVAAVVHDKYDGERKKRLQDISLRECEDNVTAVIRREMKEEGGGSTFSELTKEWSWVDGFDYRQ